MSELSVPPVIPDEGLHVIHLFYLIDHAQWNLFTDSEKVAAKTRLAELVQETRATERTQLLTFSMVTPKADLGFMLLTPDLQVANRIEKQISLSLGPDVLSPVFSYLSMTELSEYTTSETEYALGLEREQGLAPGSDAMQNALAEFRKRMAKYSKDRLYPNLPDWPAFCFYPMSKRRVPGQNWYSLPFEDRKKLMGGHARTGRKYAGKILQLITGSTGLDDAEWGVSLFARNTFDIKSIVYEMRFDPASAEFAEFGDFYIGLQLPLDQLFARVQL
jgi:peroxiredoxin